MIYVLTKQFCRPEDGGEEGGLDVTVFFTLHAAKRRAARDGDRLRWESHDSHGQCWTAEAARPGLLISYVIHECEFGDLRLSTDRGDLVQALELARPVLRRIIDSRLGAPSTIGDRDAHHRQAARAYAKICEVLGDSGDALRRVKALEAVAAAAHRVTHSEGRQRDAAWMDLLNAQSALGKCHE